MTKRVAVITDATSSTYLFPSWFSYYSGLFEPNNLFVFTYGDKQADFSRHGLGGVWSMGAAFSDVVRAPTISATVKILLDKYDAVVRCDVDEFLVADPRKYASLAAYVDAMTMPYATAMGLDVFETEGEPRLALDGFPLMAQRDFCVRSAAYNKTAVVQAPVRWQLGFHKADVAPRFDDLYLFHFKYADIKGRLDWFRHMMLQCASDSGQYAHYRNGLNELVETMQRLGGLDRKAGWEAFDSQDYNGRFLAAVVPPTDQASFYDNPSGTDDVALRIPDEFRSLF